MLASSGCTINLGTPAGMPTGALSSPLGGGRQESALNIESSLDAGGGFTDRTVDVPMPPAPAKPPPDYSTMEHAMALIVEGKMEEAARVFAPRLAAEPDASDVHCYKAAVFAHENKHDEAIAEFDRAIAINPRFEIAYNDRGLQYEQKGDFERAINDYSTAMLLGQHAVHWSNRAQIYLKQKKYRAALRDSNTAISMYQGNPSAFCTRSRVWLALQRPDNALADIQTALAGSKDNVHFLYDRGYLYFKTGKFDGAIADFDRMLELDPKNANAYFWRGRCYLSLREYSRARSDLETYIKMRPGDSAGPDWLAELPDLEYDLSQKPESPARQWALACSAQLFSQNNMGIYSLPGERLTLENIDSEKKLLREWWDVDSRATLLARLNSLNAVGHDSEWRMYENMISLPGGDLLASRAGGAPGDPDSIGNRVKLVREYAPQFRERGLLAWDLGRYICLCRWGYKCGYLSEDEAWRFMMPVAEKIQKSYKSWKQFGEEYLVGRRFWSPTLWKKDEVRSTAILNSLLTSKNSPWVYLPWDTKLQ
ncbi:MAG: DUF1266 domain-containing protein [Cyanobacteria bacterium SZAS LIN-3]|nr:DUF1266 domain-containing protein [Cyanobacteria bacterium SZAS LIN-3]